MSIEMLTRAEREEGEVHHKDTARDLVMSSLRRLRFVNQLEFRGYITVEKADRKKSGLSSVTFCRE
jgi:hypothetical protein